MAPTCVSSISASNTRAGGIGCCRESDSWGGIEPSTKEEAEQIAPRNPHQSVLRVSLEASETWNGHSLLLDIAGVGACAVALCEEISARPFSVITKSPRHPHGQPSTTPRRIIIRILASASLDGTAGGIASLTFHSVQHQLCHCVGFFASISRIGRSGMSLHCNAQQGVPSNPFPLSCSALVGFENVGYLFMIQGFVSGWMDSAFMVGDVFMVICNRLYQPTCGGCAVEFAGRIKDQHPSVVVSPDLRAGVSGFHSRTGG